MTCRARTIVFAFAVTLIGLLALTIPFWIWPLDLTVQTRFFDPEQGWFQRKWPIWEALYHFGTFPAILLALAALGAFVLSFRQNRFLPWRKLSAYFVLCMLVGPGILVNAGFKEHWGRPRPRDVEPFGGTYAHERVWVYDGSSPGKSFPCGHCSMGFYFLAAALVARRGRRALAISGFAVAFGIAIGTARIAQGGHFVSDVLWSGGFCLLTSLGLYFALGLDRNVRYQVKPDAQLHVPPWIAAGAGLTAAVAVLLVALATPYHREEVIPLDLDGTQRFELSFVLEGDEHIVSLDDAAPRIHAKGDGFGLPGSAIKSSVNEDKSSGEHYLQFKQRRSGWFTELKQVNRIRVPANQSGFVKIVVRSGKLTLNLQELAAQQKWRIQIKDPSDVQVISPPGRLDLEIEKVN